MLGMSFCMSSRSEAYRQRIVSSDDQVKAYIKKIMSQLNKWMIGGKISRLVVVITNKETGEHVERWQFDVQILGKSSKQKASKKAPDKENAAPEYVWCARHFATAANKTIEKTRAQNRNKRRRRARRKYRRRSRQYSVRSRLLSHFCLYWMEIVPSTYWSTPTQIRMSPSNGATATQKRSETEKKSSFEVSVLPATR